MEGKNLFKGVFLSDGDVFFSGMGYIGMTTVDLVLYYYGITGNVSQTAKGAHVAWSTARRYIQKYGGFDPMLIRRKSVV